MPELPDQMPSAGCRRHLHSFNAAGQCPLCQGRSSTPPWIAKAEPKRVKEPAKAEP